MSSAETSNPTSLINYANLIHASFATSSPSPFSTLFLLSLTQFSCLVVSESLQPHGLQHARLPCPSPTPEACSNSCPSSRWWHPTIPSSVLTFSSCLQSFPVSGSFPMSQFFTSGGQSTRVSASASVLPVNIQDWSPLGWTGWISLQSRGLSRVSSNTTVQKFLLCRVKKWSWNFVTDFHLWSPDSPWSGCS